MFTHIPKGRDWRISESVLPQILQWKMAVILPQTNRTCETHGQEPAEVRGEAITEESYMAANTTPDENRLKS